MFGFAIIPAIVCITAFVFLPESPRWLVGRGRVGDARTVLRKLRSEGGGSVEKELRKIQENLENSAEQNSQSKLLEDRNVVAYAQRHQTLHCPSSYIQHYIKLGLNVLPLII